MKKTRAGKQEKRERGKKIEESGQKERKRKKIKNKKDETEKK